MDTDNGAICGACPRGFEGNGRYCNRRKNLCEIQPCKEGFQCIEIDDAPFYMCSTCPAGSISEDGFTCIDIDECLTIRPCDVNVHCENLSPGFKCDACPLGFKGHLDRGFFMEAIVDDTFERQKCDDIDECFEGIARCGNLAICRNSIGSYECNCPFGYVKSNFTNDCIMIPGTCGDGVFCDKNAVCKHITGRRYGCKCKVGYAGDGKICGNDRDLDGWPDIDLGCSSIFCRQDNCPGIPNSGQVRKI